MRLLASQDYYQELLTVIPKAQRRLVLAAMIMAEGEATHRLLEAADEAAQRGVAVHIMLDVYTRHILARTPKMARWRTTKAMLARLASHGARVTYYGRIGFNPVAGRCHIKATVVDDVGYSFGGVNVSDISFENTDFMMAFEDATVADRLVRLVETVADDAPQIDLDERLDERNSLLYDAGRPRSSIIYERACELTAQAQAVYYVSQWVPSGRLAAHLSRIKDSHYYFNRPQNMLPPGSMMSVFDSARFKGRNRYHRSNYIHAKFMLFELPNGAKHIIAGSNNFSWFTVAFGTKEIALHSTDDVLWESLRRFIDDRIA